MAATKEFLAEVRDLIEQGGLKLFLEAASVACQNIGDDESVVALMLQTNDAAEGWRKDAKTIESILPLIDNISTGDTEAGENGRNAANPTAS